MTRPRPATSCRADYRSSRAVTTRWMDNDVFGHVNNVTYYSFFDSSITAWLLEHAFIGLADGPMWMVAETGCRFLSEVAFPHTLTVGLRLGRVGTSSVRWELAVFQGDADEASAEGFFVHVHVDRQTRRPLAVPAAVREALAELIVEPG